MDFADFGLHIVVALLLGAAIGIERQYGSHPAGLRTNTLVCVGAAMFVGLSHLLSNNGQTPPPIAAQVVSGIGFLGGGVILREGITVRGMNTAATLWCSAAVGSLAGAGFHAEASFGALMVLTVHLVMRPVAVFLGRWTKGMVNVDTTYEIRVVCHKEEEAGIRQTILRHVNSVAAMQVQGLSINDGDQPDRRVLVGEVFSSQRNDRLLNDLVSRLGTSPGVSSVSWQRKA
jgi:putative Mg2+ transporter-C (MgtC) family protein